MFLIKRWRKKSNSQPEVHKQGTINLCFAKDSQTPAVGGIEVDDDDLNAYPLLPPYVVLFQPKKEDIWISPTARAIFLNQPLLQWEQDAVTKFSALAVKKLKLQPDEKLPRWLTTHLTRLLQQTKYKPDAALHLIDLLFSERVMKLPIRRLQALSLLKMGFVYWHGRDVRCRPIMVIRLSRMAPLASKPADIQTAFMFAIEFCLRHMMIPGRIENWVVIIDCSGLEHMGGAMEMKDVGQSLATTLGKVYSGRMIWIKILNFPNGLMYRTLRYLVESIVKMLGKSDKVSFPSDPANALKGLVDAGQVEKWCGGTAPDLAPDEVYPFRFFATPEGYGHMVSDGSEHGQEDYDLATDLPFHEGLLWADCLEPQTSWKTRAKELPLPPGAAEAVGASPCLDLATWRQIMQTDCAPVSTEPTWRKISKDEKTLSAECLAESAEPPAEQPTTPVVQPIEETKEPLENRNDGTQQPTERLQTIEEELSPISSDFRRKLIGGDIDVKVPAAGTFDDGSPEVSPIAAKNCGCWCV